MSGLYLETSALLGWLFDESGEAKVRERIEAAESVVTSALTWAETERALTRGVAVERLREADAQRVRHAVARIRSTCITMGVTNDVLARAGRPFPVEPVRTIDAVHLATALAFATAFADLVLLSTDSRIVKNATSLGLPICNPA